MQILCAPGVRWTHVATVGNKLRVKPLKAEGNLEGSGNKLEPCSNHIQTPPWCWTFSIMPTNNFLTVKIKKKIKSILSDMPGWLFGFETRSFWLWSLTIFSSVHFLHHSTFIDPTTPCFPSDEVFHDLLYYVSFRMKASLCWDLTWSSSWPWASHSPWCLCFSICKEGGWTLCVLLDLTFCDQPHGWWKLISELVQPAWSEANVGLCQLIIKMKQPCSLL